MRFSANGAWSLTVTNHELVAILAGLAAYAIVFLWAEGEALRRRRWGWAAVIWILGPVAVLAWVIRGRRDVST